MATVSLQSRHNVSDSLPELDGQAVQLQPSLADMIALLERINPDSDAQALRVLRDAFADRPLPQRIAACATWKR
jgi:hypothetical protein